MNNNIFNRMPHIYRNNIHSANESYNNKVFMNEFQVPINRNIGFVEVFVFTDRGEFAIPGALITIYVRQENYFVPIFNIPTENSPIIVGLPVAHPLGTLIRGPEYYFTAYDITVNAANFAPYRCNNIRLFEGITTKFNVDMLRLVPQQYPLPENVVNIPPHPRDVLNA
ncbi:hypothetical protein [Sedimentibacter sp.]|uniref:hypothetical protein n=1 Tax=Sedimentibacter sp. TaxID=1960295 RepID=UPI0028AE1BCE|nr:hypothetical protein [Sedimentibacter sp.]